MPVEREAFAPLFNFALKEAQYFPEETGEVLLVKATNAISFSSCLRAVRRASGSGFGFVLRATGNGLGLLEATVRHHCSRGMFCVIRYWSCIPASSPRLRSRRNQFNAALLHGTAAPALNTELRVRAKY